MWAVFLGYRLKGIVHGVLSPVENRENEAHRENALFIARPPLACYCFGFQPSFFFKVNSHIYRIQEYQEYLQMEKQLLEELGIREESDDQPEV